MDSSHFDALSHWIAHRLPRRSFFGLLVAVAAASETRDVGGAKKKKRRAANRDARRKRRGRNALLQSLIPDVQSEVVGGTAVPQGTFDFATYVEVDLGNDGAFACTGTLITPRHVLTAAHCVVDDDIQTYDPSVFLTAIGRASLQNVPQANIRGVAAVFRHPDYNPETFRNDVAVLQLRGDVPPSIARPVALVGSDDTRFDGAGQAAIVTGWGQTSGGGPSSSQLLQARLSVISDAACAEEIEIQPDVHICASAERAISCYGDSGGPLFVTTVAAASEPESVGVERSGLVEVEKKKKRRKRGKNKGTTPAPVPPPPPAASPPVSPPASPPPPPTPPPAGIATQLGVVSYGFAGCPVDTPDVYTQLSAPEVRSFVTQVAGV